MGRPAARDLTERELEVMQVFWARAEATAAEARDALAASGSDRTYATIANLIRGLHEKGFLHPLNDERPFRYRPGRSRDEVTGRLLGDLVERAFGGSRALLLKRLVDHRKLSAEERAALEAILKEQG